MTVREVPLNLIPANADRSTIGEQAALLSEWVATFQELQPGVHLVPDTEPGNFHARGSTVQTLAEWLAQFPAYTPPPPPSGAWQQLLGASAYQDHLLTLAEHDAMVAAGSAPFWANLGPATLESWSGAYLDRATWTIYVAGGGHDWFGGNGVSRLPLATLLWEQFKLHAPLATSAPYEPVEGGFAAHEYDGLVAVAGKLLRLSYSTGYQSPGPNHLPQQPNRPTVWALDMATAEWSDTGTRGLSFPATATLPDGTVWAIGDEGAMVIAPDGTMTAVPLQGHRGSFDSGAMCWHPNGSAYAIQSTGEPFVWRVWFDGSVMRNELVANLSSLGDGFSGWITSGIAVRESSGDIYITDGSTREIVVNPDTGAVTHNPPSGPGPSNPGRLYGKFWWLAAPHPLGTESGFLLLDKHGEVWFREAP